ncbi:hypothetical protein LB506_009131 [Fusarium annulatum]|nr:hypothetical protein LB506_009131 [Fusarium annulatum]
MEIQAHVVQKSHGRLEMAKRGWKYQEAVFSRRHIFTKELEVHENLEAYSKRELTYDSDVLRAMEGIFGFYAQLEPSVEQYWGLPLRWVGC